MSGKGPELIMLNETITITKDELINILTDVTDIGQPVLVLTVDPITGRPIWVWEIPPHWNEITAQKVTKLRAYSLADDVAAIVEPLLVDPDRNRALLPVGAQFAWLAKHPSVIEEIEAQTVFLDAAARLINAGLTRSYA